ncbi:MAG: hypothetical protein MUF18_00230 [Fimbriiglobus sp.]|nr:hypothetical protein [Fimbriiglobus sp.]
MPARSSSRSTNCPAAVPGVMMNGRWVVGEVPTVASSGVYPTDCPPTVAVTVFTRAA